MRRLTTEIFIERAKAKHGDKYDYSKVEYRSIDSKVDIICPKHGVYQQRPYDHLGGRGCSKCSNKCKWTTEEWVVKAKQIHGDDYDYSKVVYERAHSKVCIICSKHGEFWVTPNNHIRGKGCPICGSIRTGLYNKLTLDEFIRKAESIHGNKYDYSKVDYINNHTKVCIICPKHGEFWQVPNSHLSGKGCPKCAHINSTFEEFCYDNLLNCYDELDIEREYNEDERYPFHCDFYIKSKDLFIEVNGFWTHGGHWFDETNEEDISRLLLCKNKNSSMYSSFVDVWTRRDVEKRDYARKNNLNYVVFWTKDDIELWFNKKCPIRKDWK